MLWTCLLLICYYIYICVCVCVRWRFLIQGYCYQLGCSVHRILLDKHFHKNHKLHKIFNQNNVKVSYSCIPNVSSIVNSHNQKILQTPKLTTLRYRNKIRATELSKHIWNLRDNVTNMEIKCSILDSACFQKRLQNMWTLPHLYVKNTTLFFRNSTSWTKETKSYQTVAMLISTYCIV